MKSNKKSKIKSDNFVLAEVTATMPQLEEIGIDEDITHKLVRVYDIDKYNGIYPNCSRIVVDNEFEWLAKKGINVDYIIPTMWLSFS